MPEVLIVNEDVVLQWIENQKLGAFKYNNINSCQIITYHKFTKTYYIYKGFTL